MDAFEHLLMSIRHLLKRAGLVLTYLQSRHKSLLHSETTQERVRIEGPPILLKADAAQAIAAILHELSTNAARYGALSVDSGRVNLNWSHEKDARLHLHWTETGGPKVQEPTRKGFGSRIIEQMTIQQSGKTRFDWRSDGLICEITLQV